MNKNLTICAIALLLAGCSSSLTVEQAQTFAPCTFPDSPKDEAPSWICDVMPTDIKMAATGYAKKSSAGLSVMRRIAANDARVSLVSAFEVDINSMFKQAMESNLSTDLINGETEVVLEVVESTTKSIVSRTLNNSKILVSQTSPSGGIYVLIGLDETAYQANLKSVINAVNNDTELWKKFNNEKATKNLESMLNSLKNI